jgi:hypothetical protein
MIRDELLPLEKELYDAWVAYYEMPSGLSDEEAGAISARCYKMYERAYTELGGRWTQHIIKTARQDTGFDL